jgi:hypothetical protein
MATLIAILTWGLRLAGLVSTAEKLYAAYEASQNKNSAAKAQKAVADEDHRELSIAAAPDKSPDELLGRMSDGQL